MNWPPHTASSTRPTAGVAGSIPVEGTHGLVTEWLGRGLRNQQRRFDPGRGLVMLYPLSYEGMVQVATGV
jgi:hypothetical protein